MTYEAGVHSNLGPMGLPSSGTTSESRVASDVSYIILAHFMASLLYTVCIKYRTKAFITYRLQVKLRDARTPQNG